MATEEVLSFSVASVLEEVLQQNGTRLSDIDLASRKAEEAALRRYEAAQWLRKTVGVVGGKDLPAQPSEEEFRLGLRSGIMLCNVLNKIQPGTVPKVVEGPSASVITHDGAALSAFQYFENLRNFLVSVEELGLPTFEASDFEQGGKSARIINCILALKSYSEWKQGGGNGSWKFGANAKPSTAATGKPFMRKNSELFMNSFSRTSSLGEKSVDSMCSELANDLSEAGASGNLSILVRAVLSDKKQEEIPFVVESMLNKVMEEFERQLVSQNEQMKAAPKDMEISVPHNSLTRSSSGDLEMEDDSPIHEKMEEEFPINEKMEEEAATQINAAECSDQNYNHDEEEAKARLLKQKMLVELQQRNILELKETLHTAKAGMQLLQVKYQEEFKNLGKRLYSLANAASGYQRVLDENRKLYNQVQDLKGNIRVYCRVRPFLNGQPNLANTVDRIEEGNIVITIPAKYGKESRRLFSFNKVFGPAATQAAVFEDTQALIRSVLDGYNVCIFAYGQTGSGKTYTMSGPNELTEEGLGVNYRALSDLFVLANQRKDTISYDISVQMLEIYNEQVRDLLTTDGSLNKRLEIRNSSQNGINVPEANLVPVLSTSDVINLMNLGQKNRAVCSTAMNDRSSRSHSCLTVHVQGRNLTSGSILRGSMHLVDLAGSERVDKSEVTGDRLKEAQHINKSLSALGDVIASLAQKSNHVPYRNSKLTQLLQDSLGGQAKTLMFVHISPEPDALGETISTLKFAERVATIELGAAKVNKDSADVKDLKEQIASLKAALARKDGETEQLHFARPSTPDRLKMKSGSGSSSPSNSSSQSIGDISSNHRQPMEEVGNIQVRKQSASKLRRKSLDPRDLLVSSPAWPPVSIPVVDSKEDDRESGSGDWVDKVMLNKDDILSRDDDLLANWEADNNRQLSEMFYQNYPLDPTKKYPEQTTNSLIPNRRDNQDYDDSDHEAAASDCSEADSLSPHFNIQKASSIPNGLGSKTKKTQPKAATRSIETRSLIPSLIPSPPSRTLKSSPSLKKSGRQPVFAEGKRKTGLGK